MISDFLKERKLDKQYDESIDNAVNQFIQQRNSIREIYETKGYKQIVKWLEVEKMQAMKLVMASGKDRSAERARYNAADRLLTFLENLANAK